MQNQRSHTQLGRATRTPEIAFFRKVAQISAAFIGSVTLLSPAQGPSEYDQYAIELINLARSNPNGEVSRLASSTSWVGAPSLNEGIAAGTISSTPKQPLAIDGNLTTAGSLYTSTLIANDAFSHNYGGTTSASRAIAAGVDVSGGTSQFSENLAVTLSGWPISISGTRIDSQHEQLFVDGTVNNRGHRVTMMGDQWTRIGVGTQTDSNYNLVPSAPNVLMQAQEFAWVDGDHFITGVIFNDLNFNNFYTPGTGEALGGATVEAFEAGTFNRVATTTAFSSGGYSLEVEPGSYDVYVFGSGYDSKVSNVAVGSQNVKLDFIDPGDSPVPEPSALIYTVIATWILGMRRRRKNS